MNQKGTIVFVTIGVPCSAFPIMQKVMTYVETDLGITPIDAANGLRMLVARNIRQFGWDPGPNFDYKELYYEIYGSIHNSVPFAMSFNSRYRRERVPGRFIEGITESQLAA